MIRVAWVACAWFAATFAWADDGRPVGLGDPGSLEKLVVETGDATLAGRDAGRQLLVTGHYSTGQVRDWTRRVRYSATPMGIVQVDAQGYASAVAEGEATVRAEGPDGRVATAKLRVVDVVRDLPVHFANDVVPILTRFGCNAGGCHGKSGGQNGFALSLLGFEPDDDYEYLVKEARGRRLMPAAPAQSMFLTKAIGAAPHGGGKKLPAESAAYRVLLRWIEQGNPRGQADEAAVTRIEVVPAQRPMERDASQQLAVLAHLSDGRVRDVTRLAQFEANDADLASVSETGHVVTKMIPGAAVVMARFQSHVGVFRATVPLGAPVAQLPPVKNFVDEKIFAQLKRLGLPPSGLCDDGTFLRRATIDLAGRLPTLDETRAFLADAAGDKREQLVDRLLASNDYADHFAQKWSAILRNKRHSPKEDAKPTAAFHQWIRKSIAENVPFDQFARAILTATGEEIANPPVTWYRELKEATAQVEDAAQLFLGTRLQCARCHHHPLERWSQHDYYGLAAFFSQVGYKGSAKDDKKNAPKGKDAPKKLVTVLLKDGVPGTAHPRTKETVPPTFLGGLAAPAKAGDDPRALLADWMADGKNPYFARTLANRTWKHFLGRGLVEPEDDLRVTNPPTNPELLDALADYVVAAKFDVKKLIRAICVSSTYQLQAEPNAFNGTDKQNFARFHPRRLHAEVLFDAIDQVTLAKSEFPGAPAGTRAVQLPDNAFESYFLAVFGRPDMSSACECERVSEVNLSQMLHLMNSYEVLTKIGGKLPSTTVGKADAKTKKAGPKTKVFPGERLTRIVADKRSHDEKLRELYLIAHAREPREAELSALRTHLERVPDVRAAYEDILWALVNSEDFLFNR